MDLADAQNAQAMKLSAETAPGEEIVRQGYLHDMIIQGMVRAYRIGWHLCEQRHRREADERTERFVRAMKGESYGGTE